VLFPPQTATTPAIFLVFITNISYHY